VVDSTLKDRYAAENKMGLVCVSYGPRVVHIEQMHVETLGDLNIAGKKNAAEWSGTSNGPRNRSPPNRDTTLLMGGAVMQYA
jgi:hypothetical protein